ncbi:MAG: hypothetical protein Q8Q49_04160 [bacterium]|nr:hypothetical protein [bacterium]
MLEISIAHDRTNTQQLLNQADVLFGQQAEWTTEENGVRLGRIDEIANIVETLPSLVTYHAEAIDYHPDTHRAAATLAFLERALWSSPLPPVNISEFIRQIVVSQASQGEIPLAVQQIACLNYLLVTRPIPYGERQDLEILPISNTQPKKRWRRFLDEERDFLLGLTEIGVRPVISFGVSDVLDFEQEGDFSHTPEELTNAVDQNRKTMRKGIESLDRDFTTIPLPDPRLRPQLRVFLHSEVLEGEHGQIFETNYSRIREQEATIEALRQWLFSHFPRIYGRSRQDPNHPFRLSKMLSLYATDNMLAASLTRDMFPGEPVQHVTSVSLQPQETWEWIEEKIGCALLGIPMTQISPFQNAGNWHGKPEKSGVYSIRSEHGLNDLSPQQAFVRLIKEDDKSILPEIEPSEISGDEVMRRKVHEARTLTATTFGEKGASVAEEAYRERRHR